MVGGVPGVARVAILNASFRRFQKLIFLRVSQAVMTLAGHPREGLCVFSSFDIVLLNQSVFPPDPERSKFAARSR